MSLLIVVLMYATWSSVFSLGKITLQYCSPIFLTGSRMVLAGILLLGFFLIKQRFWPPKTMIESAINPPWWSVFKFNKKQWLSLFLLSFFSIYLTNTLEFWGLQYLTAAKTCFIYSLSPFFTAFFSYIHFNERMNRNKWIGFSVAFLGCLPVLLTQAGSEELFSVAGFLSWPTLAVMGAALCSVYGWILLRVMVKNLEMSPIMVNGISMLVGGLLALGNSVFVESWLPIPVATGHFAGFFQGALIMTILFNLICYNLYGHMLKRFTATFLSFVGLLSPIFASLSAWVLLNEPPSWTILLSTAVVSCGLWIVYRTELKQGYIVKKDSLTTPLPQ